MPLVNLKVLARGTTNPIDSVVVSVFDTATRELLAQDVTTAEGDASFLLPGGASPGVEYLVYLYKRGALFTNPTRIQVDSATANDFEAEGDLLTLPIAFDPALCCCTGTFFDGRGRPLVNGKVHFHITEDFILPSGWPMVTREPYIVETDSKGQVSIEMFRGYEYLVVFPGGTEEGVRITIPDAPSADLNLLLNPPPAPTP